MSWKVTESLLKESLISNLFTKRREELRESTKDGSTWRLGTVGILKEQGKHVNY